MKLHYRICITLCALLSLSCEKAASNQSASATPAPQPTRGVEEEREWQAPIEKIGASVEYNSLWRLKEGRSKSISFDLINRLCGALECEPGDLFEYSPDKKNGSAIKLAAKKKGARAR